MTDTLTAKIKAEVSAAVLASMRDWARDEGIWHEPTHGPLYAAQQDKIKQRWEAIRK